MSIQDKYNTFVRENHSIPSYAVASVHWKDSDEIVDNLTFSLSEDCDDDKVFFNTTGIYEIETLTNKSNGEDFYILEDTIKFY